VGSSHAEFKWYLQISASCQAEEGYLWTRAEDTKLRFWALELQGWLNCCPYTS
jgi:hypothetical protein